MFPATRGNFLQRNTRTRKIRETMLTIVSAMRTTKCWTWTKTTTRTSRTSFVNCSSWCNNYPPSQGVPHILPCYFHMYSILSKSNSMTWKFKDFSATQILREINLGWFQKVKNAILPIWEGLDFAFYENFIFASVKNSQKFTFWSAKMVNKLFFGASKWPK